MGQPGPPSPRSYPPKVMRRVTKISSRTSVEKSSAAEPEAFIRLPGQRSDQLSEWHVIRWRAGRDRQLPRRRRGQANLNDNKLKVVSESPKGECADEPPCKGFPSMVPAPTLD